MRMPKFKMNKICSFLTLMKCFLIACILVLANRYNIVFGILKN